MKSRIRYAASVSSAAALILACTAATLPTASFAGIAVGISIGIAPPPLPVYVQPVIPAPGYLWTPGYWAWDAAGADYYWVPGTWVAPPFVGGLWTPGYWGWAGGSYLWHGGYWGHTVGFYGGVNYGFGYVGSGYLGGRWEGGQFSYNRTVNNINPTFVHNTYNTTVVENNTHVSYNGGNGGVAARPTPEEQAARAEPHVPPTAVQRQHEQAAAHDPAQHFAANHGAPAHVALARPASFQGGSPGQAQGGPHGAPGGANGHAVAMHDAGRPAPGGPPHGGPQGHPGGGHEGHPGGGEHEGHPGGGEHGHER